ncbi:Putative membrane protein YfcA [hydrothermal vent metagenome]|uniref:Membrane protein YfcA n=1 Tax=hydrothermal vent metagenome TaxID=652676 RepID=A0A160TSJ9_9ZZZZ
MNDMPAVFGPDTIIIRNNDVPVTPVDRDLVVLNLATNVAGLSAMIVGGKVLWLPGFGMAAANVAGNQVGARLAIRFGGRGVRPLLVVMSFALTVKLLADPRNPLWSLF